MAGTTGFEPATSDVTGLRSGATPATRDQTRPAPDAVFDRRGRVILLPEIPGILTISPSQAKDAHPLLGPTAGCPKNPSPPDEACEDRKFRELLPRLQEEWSAPNPSPSPGIPRIFAPRCCEVLSLSTPGLDGWRMRTSPSPGLWVGLGGPQIELAFAGATGTTSDAGGKESKK
jgi:hypothetical protein